MTAPPSERLLDLMGDVVVRTLVRQLALADATQRELVESTELAQSVVSRALTLMRAAGLIGSEGLRSPKMSLRARDETIGLLLSADHLAARLGSLDTSAQAARTSEDRRLAVRPTDAESHPAPEEGRPAT